MSMTSIDELPSVGDGIGEWWVYPLATYLTAPVERTVVGAVASNGTLIAAEFDHTNGTETRVEVGAGVPDDHNCPAIWAAEGRRMVMLWTQHSRDRLLQARVSDADGSVLSLRTAAVQDFTASTGVSYSIIHRIEHLSTPEQDTFWVFVRVGNYSWAIVPFSVDQATGVITWGVEQRLVTGSYQVYLSVMDAHAPGDQTLRVAWGFNPGPTHNPINYLEINTVTGAVSSPVDPSIVANVAGAGLPLEADAVTPLLPDVLDTQSRRLHYVRPGPALPAIAYAEWDRDDVASAVYKLIYLTEAGEWEIREYGTSGPTLHSNGVGSYIGGMAFPDPCPDDQVVVARKASGLSTVEAFRSDASGTFPRTLVEDPMYRLARPMPAKGGGVEHVVVSRVRHYGVTYEDYLADVVSLYVPPVPVALVRSASPTILCGELRTGRILSTVPVSAATWEQRLREAGTVTATVPLLAHEVTVRPELLMGLEGARSYLAAEHQGTILEAGPIWVHDVDDATLMVGAGGLASLFDHRQVIRVLTAGQNAAKVKDLTYSGMSYGTIAKRLISTAMAHTGGDLPVILPADSPGAASRTYPATQLASFGDQIRELMQVQGGPDISFRPEFTPDGLAIRWRMLVGTTADPMLHQAGADWDLDTTVPRSSVSGLRIRRDWSELTMRSWATGDGQDEAQLIERAVDNGLLDRGYPLLESVRAYPRVKVRADLRSHAASRLRVTRRPRATWSL
ncbi:hypothetical protein, partial [Cellulomonas olei]|uniref:hypothetical protein n=1 Tax=Cellulomonas sp. P4 TaxID=3142533 RepID=UPI0031BA3C0B